MNSLQNYTVVIRPDDKNAFVAYIPAIEGCHAWGETSEAARAKLDYVFATLLEEYREIGLSLPQDVELVVASAS